MTKNRNDKEVEKINTNNTGTQRANNIDQIINMKRKREDKMKDN